MSTGKVVAIVIGAVLLLGGGIGAGLYFGKSGGKSSGGNVITDNAIVDQSGNKRPGKTKPSTDKSTWFIKDYVGRNASDSCSYRLNGECMEDYGDATLNVKFITEDGSKVSKDNVSNYMVTDQSVDPDTQLNLTYADGYNYVESQNIEELVLNVKLLSSDQSNN